MELLRRSNSFRRKVKATAGEAAGGRSTALLRANVHRLSGKKWISRFAVLHEHALCLYVSPNEWTPFRSFPSEVVWRDGLHVRSVPVYSEGEPDRKGAYHISVETPGAAPVLLAFSTPSEAAQWVNELSQPRERSWQAHAAAPSLPAHDKESGENRQPHRDQSTVAATRQSRLSAAETLHARLRELSERRSECEARVAAARERARAASEAAIAAKRVAEAAEADAADIDQVQLERVLQEVGLARDVAGSSSFAYRLRAQLTR